VGRCAIEGALIRTYDGGPSAPAGGRDVTEKARDTQPRAPDSPNHADSVPGTLVPGRTCGTCSLCCKVYAVPELSKPVGRWCTFSVRGGGCSNHENRPDVCRQFFCSWRFDPHLGPEWKPEVCRFVMSADQAYQALTVSVDPGMPTAWKREPYYSTLKKFSDVFFRINRKLLVNLNGHVTVVLPDRDVPLGMIVPGEEIIVWREGLTYGARLRRDLNQAKPGVAPPHSGSM
jgi:hypothetical protein